MIEMSWIALLQWQVTSSTQCERGVKDRLTLPCIDEISSSSCSECECSLIGFDLSHQTIRDGAFVVAQLGVWRGDCCGACLGLVCLLFWVSGLPSCDNLHEFGVACLT